MAGLAPAPTHPPMAARAPGTFLHRSLMHACPASLDRLRVFHDRELRPSPGSAIFSLRDANALTHGVMGGPTAYAGRAVWCGPRNARGELLCGRVVLTTVGRSLHGAPLMARADTIRATYRQAPVPPATPRPPALPRVGPERCAPRP
jgi:hypothetical protein